jgi:hypothetical protein
MDQRKYERVQLTEDAGVHLAEPSGALVGTIRMLGLGGILLQTDKTFAVGERRDFLLVDEGEGIRRPVKIVALYSIPTGVGLRFEKLDEQTAVEIGVIIGKHNAARSAAGKK